MTAELISPVNLSNLITTLSIQTQPGERWAVLGPEADAFGVKLHPATVFNTLEPELDGILLAGALSAQNDPLTWLQQVIKSARKQAILVVVDWQGDGSLDHGPDLKLRFKRGKLYRLLREWGCGILETLDNHTLYYVVRAIKSPPLPTPHAGKFVDVAGLDELPRNEMKLVELFDHKIIVANTGKEIVAFAQTCPHSSSRLDKGRLRGRNVICPLHAYIWNIYTGEPVEPADEDILPRYPVKVDPKRGRVFVALALHRPDQTSNGIEIEAV